MKVYKLTDSDRHSYGGMLWGKGMIHEVTGEVLMRHNGLHAYAHPVLAALFYPAHVPYSRVRLFEAQGEGDMKQDSTKMCFRKLTTVKEIPMPQIPLEQRVEILMRLVLAWKETPAHYKQWAKKWLSGQDRSQQAIWDLELDGHGFCWSDIYTHRLWNSILRGAKNCHSNYQALARESLACSFMELIRHGHRPVAITTRRIIRMARKVMR